MSADSTSKRTVRFGILGAARIAPAALIRPASRSANATVEVVAARDPERAKAFARKHRIPRIADTYEAVISDPDIDAVYIPLPNSLHFDWTVASMEAGKHVLCEKPLTSNAREAQRVVEELTGRSSGRTVVAEAFHYRYHPLAKRMLEVARSDELGEIRHIEAWLCAPIPSKSDIRYQAELSGGALMDMGCYVVNLARYLGEGEPEVTSAKAKLLTSEVDRAMTVDLRFPAGCTARVACSMWSSSMLHVSARVTGERGRMTVFNPFAPHTASFLRVVSDEGSRVEIPSRRPTYSFQLDAFCEAVNGGGTVQTDPSDAAANMAVIDSAYSAAGMRPRGEQASA